MPDGKSSCAQESREQALESQLVAARWSSLRGAVEEAEKIIQDSLSQIDDPAHISCTSSAGGRPIPTRSTPMFGARSHMHICSADYLASRCQASLDSLDHLNSSIKTFMDDNSGEKANIKNTEQQQNGGTAQEFSFALYACSCVGTSASSYPEWPPGGRHHCPGQRHLTHGASGEI